MEKTCAIEPAKNAVYSLVKI